MQKHYNYLTIDLDRKIYSTLKAKQGDSKSRYILVNLISNNLPYDLTGTSVKIYGMKKDTTIFFNAATIIDAENGKFEIELTNQALAVAGYLKVEILVTGSNQERLTTSHFYINVEETIVNDAAIESTNEFTALTKALSSVQNIDNRFNEVNEQFISIQSDYNTKITEVAEKGTTVEVVTNTTKTQIDKYIADGTIANMTIADNSVNITKLDFVKPIGVNLFNYLAIDANCYYDPLNGNRVDRDVSIGTNMSEFIVIEPSTNYIRLLNNTAQNCVVFYDENKQYISGIHSANSFLTPSNAKYVCIQVATSVLKSEMLVKGTTKPDEYIPFTDDYQANSTFKVNGDNILDNSIDVEKINHRIGVYVGNNKPKPKYSYWVKCEGYPFENHTHACFLAGEPDYKNGKYFNKGYGDDAKLIGITRANVYENYIKFEGTQGLSISDTKNLKKGYTIHMLFNPKSSLNSPNNTYFRIMKQKTIDNKWIGLNVVKSNNGDLLSLDCGGSSSEYIYFKGDDTICLSIVVSIQTTKVYVNGEFINEIPSYDFSKIENDTMMTIGHQFADVDQVNKRFAIMDFYSLLVTENILEDEEVKQVYNYLTSLNEIKFNSDIYANVNGTWENISTNNKNTSEINIKDEANLYDSNNVEEALEEIKLQANENEKRTDKIPNNLILADENGKEYRITVNTQGELQAKPTFVTPPAGFPGITFEGESPYRGEFLVGIHAQNYNGKHFIFSLNHKGHLLRYKEVPDYAIDFKKTITKSGKVRYTYQQRINPGNAWGHVEGLGYNFAEFVVMNEDWEEIDRVTLKAHGNVPEGHPVDCHESLIIDDGHYILTAYHSRTIPNYNADGTGAKIIQGVVQEIKDNQVVFHWESGNVLNTLADSYQDNNFTSSSYQEYLHLNAVWIDEKDNNLIVSLRNLNALYKLNRQNGEIIWILGGKRDMFGMTEAQKFSRQHAPKILEDGSILLFNNGNDKQRSSIMEFKLDETEMVITKFKEHTWHNDDGSINFSPAMGNVNKLYLDKNIYAICWGVKISESSHYWCEEIDFDKGISLCRFKPNNGHDIYRVHRYLE